MAICAWLDAGPPYTSEAQATIDRVCRDFLCPSLATADDYCGWMAHAGLESIGWTDLTDQVVPTWEICLQRIRRSGIKRLGWIAGRNMKSFLHGFESILQAYRSGAMKYGCFVARK